MPRECRKRERIKDALDPRAAERRTTAEVAGGPLRLSVFASCSGADFDGGIALQGLMYAPSAFSKLLDSGPWCARSSLMVLVLMVSFSCEQDREQTGRTRMDWCDWLGPEDLRSWPGSKLPNCRRNGGHKKGLSEQSEHSCSHT